MRKTERLDDFYETIKILHKKYFPDWRFGQLIHNFLSWCGNDGFYLEDDHYINKFIQFVNETINGKKES